MHTYKCFFQTLAVLMLCFSYRACFSSTCLMQCVFYNHEIFICIVQTLSHCITPTQVLTLVHLHFYWIHILRQIFWLQLPMQMLLHAFAWCCLSLAYSNMCIMYICH